MDSGRPIARGIIAAFDHTVETLRNIFNILNIGKSQRDEEKPVEYEILNKFENLTESSTDEDCLEIVKKLKGISFGSKFAVIKNETAIEDFSKAFKKFRDLVERKLSLPMDEWKVAKQDSIYFDEAYGKLEEELDYVRGLVEATRLRRERMMAEHGTEGETRRRIKTASEDFKSLHPSFIIANASEHMERISILQDKKLRDSLADKVAAEQKCKSCNLKYKEELKYIMQEVTKTKTFIDWLEEKDHAKMKEYEAKIKEEWKQFSREMETAREISHVYFERNAICLAIEKEKGKGDRLAKENAAATVIQKHFRGFLVRRELKEKAFLGF